MTTDHDFDDVDLTVFTLTCAECDAGDHITSYDQASAEGWTRVTYAPDLPMANYVGICPDCRPHWEGITEHGDVVPQE
jgi:hypothetical protein